MPGAGNAAREFLLPLEAERSWRRRRGENVLRLSALGATFECERLLRRPLRISLGILQLGLVERGDAGGEGRFPILRRLGPSAVVPREQGIEGWLWTRSAGSTLTMLGDEDVAPNAAVLFTKPLDEEAVASSFASDALAEIAARSPLGAPAIHGLLFRVADPSQAETVFRQFHLSRPLTDREVPPASRRSLPTDRPADPALCTVDESRVATSVAPPTIG